MRLPWGWRGVPGFPASLNLTLPIGTVAGQELEESLDDAGEKMNFKKSHLLLRSQAIQDLERKQIHFSLPDVVPGGGQQSVVIQDRQKILSFIQLHLQLARFGTRDGDLPQPLFEVLNSGATLLMQFFDPSLHVFRRHLGRFAAPSGIPDRSGLAVEFSGRDFIILAD